MSLAYQALVKGKGFETNDVHAMDAQQLSAHIVHLARATAERLDMISDYEISLVMRVRDDLPIFIRTFEKGVNHLRNRDDLTGIHKFQPVTGILAANIPADEALETVRSLALDIMNQGGPSDLGKRYLKDEL